MMNILMLLARREFLIGSAVWSARAAQKKKKSDAAAPPSILLIVADGIASWMLGCGGNTQIHTPNIDLLAKGGTRFAESFASAPASSSNCATLFSGRLAPSPQGDAMLFDALAAAGYTCGYVGKWDLAGAQPAQHHIGYAPANPGLPDRVTAQAKEFLDQQGSGKPFLLAIGYSTVLDGLPSRYYDLYARSTFEAMGRDPISAAADQGKDMLKDLVANIRKFAAGVTAVDDQLPVLLAKLHERKLDNETLIVLTSTDGSLLGRHGLWGDGHASNPVNMYEEVIQVPMIWNWPGQVPVENVRNELVSLYDALPSLCEAAGATPPANPRGRSYATLAFGRRLPKKQPWRNVVFGLYGNLKMVRDSRYKLILREPGKGPNELFDLNLDAREKVNRYDALNYISIREQMTRALAGVGL